MSFMNLETENAFVATVPATRTSVSLSLNGLLAAAGARAPVFLCFKTCFKHHRRGFNRDMDIVYPRGFSGL